MVALLVVLTIPFSLLFALVCMWLTDIPIGLLSIGAIDFGILVDGTVIMVDNIVRHLARRHHDPYATGIGSRDRRCHNGSSRPDFLLNVDDRLRYLPIVSLTSIEGLLFRPMAHHGDVRPVGSCRLCLVRHSCGELLCLASRTFRLGEPVLRLAGDVYANLLGGLLSKRWMVLLLALSLMLAIGGLVVPRLGFDFLPYLDEGVVWVRANFPEGTSLDEASNFGNQMRAIAHEFPGCRVCDVPSRPQRQWHRSLSPQPGGDDDRPQAV